MVLRVVRGLLLLEVREGVLGEAVWLEWEHIAVLLLHVHLLLHRGGGGGGLLVVLRWGLMVGGRYREGGGAGSGVEGELGVGDGGVLLLLVLWLSRHGSCGVGLAGYAGWCRGLREQNRGTRRRVGRATVNHTTWRARQSGGCSAWGRRDGEGMREVAAVAVWAFPIPFPIAAQLLRRG